MRTAPDAPGAAGDVIPNAIEGLFEGANTLLGVTSERGPEGIEAAVRRVFAPGTGDEAAGLWSVWRSTLRALRPLGALSLGNRIEVLDNGDDVFEAMWSAIDHARVEVLMTTYILEPDAVGLRTLAALTAAAERGCRVILVFDSFGSLSLDARHLAALRKAGATVVAFNPLLRWHRRSWRRRVSRLVRNHQKILVVDGAVGFCGGMNVAEEYAGERFGNGFFRDTHMRIRGPSVRDLGQLVTDAIPDEEAVPPSAVSLGAGSASAVSERDQSPRAEGTEAGGRDGGGDGCLVQVLESNVGRQRRAIQRSMRMTVRRAVERCSFTTPYFVPPRRLMRALVSAAARGVEVRILTAGRSDVRMVHWASQHLYGRLLRRGIRIFELYPRALHAKTMAVDGVYCAVGSFNLDQWSDRRNLEVKVAILDRPTAERIEAQFERDLEGAREILLETWKDRTLPERLLHWAAYQLMRI